MSGSPSNVRYSMPVKFDSSDLGVPKHSIEASAEDSTAIGYSGPVLTSQTVNFGNQTAVDTQHGQLNHDTTALPATHPTLHVGTASNPSLDGEMAVPQTLSVNDHHDSTADYVRSEMNVDKINSNGKLARQYVLPDGSIAMTGKGLGKGRPGIKRGPRQVQQLANASTEPSPGPSQYAPVPPILAPQPSTPKTVKRKRTDSVISNVRALSVASSQSRESTPEYNPTASQTRSGRQTQKPTSLISISPTTRNPSTKKSNSSSSTSTPNLKLHPKIKRRVYKGKEQFALCEHCLRGFGPENNVIVFCDACNKCWHQRCHDPQISRAVVADTKAEWFCVSCDKILHGGKKGKKPPTPIFKTAVEVESNSTPQTQPRPQQLPQQYGLPLIGGISLTLDQRRAYLNTLAKEQLINLILHASDLAPQLPMFETPLPPPTYVIPQLPLAQQLLHKPQPQFASNYVTPVDKPLPENTTDGGNDNNHNNGVTAGSNETQSGGYEDRIDEHALLYPRPGEGVPLPPDRVDLNMLLEGPESRTFSHWVRGVNMKNFLDNVTLVQG